MSGGSVAALSSMKPAVSILMPVYNASDTLPACIESVLGQTFTDMEVVCVDDGSTDGSAEIIENAMKGDGRVALVKGGRRGIVGALNLGLARCRGRYVARMDSDDLMDPRRIEIQVGYLEQAGDFDLIGTRVRMISDSGFLSSGVLRYEKWTNSLISHDEIVRDIFVESPIVHPTFFTRRKLFEELGGYRETPWAEDYDFLLRAHLKGATFGKVEDELLLWRDSEGRLLRSDERCSRGAMFKAKAHYFFKTEMGREKRKIVIAGTGPSGRTVARLLMNSGRKVHCFVDNLRGPEGREVMGIRAHGFDGPVPPGFFHELKDPFCILCIGDDEGRDHFIAQIEGAGMSWGRDYVRFI